MPLKMGKYFGYWDIIVPVVGWGANAFCCMSSNVWKYLGLRYQVIWKKQVMLMLYGG